MLTVDSIRALKGAPLAVLCVLLLARQPVTQEFCERHTGYTDKPVSQALRLLEELGYITQNGRISWQIAGDTAQLPFILPNGDSPTPDPAPAAAQIVTNKIISSRKYSDSKQLTAATAIGRTNIKRSEAADESELFRLNLAKLHQAGIMGKKAAQLAALEQITPAYITAHKAYADHRGDSIGLLICRLQDGDPPPEPEPQSELDSQRYISGPLAKFIQY